MIVGLFTVHVLYDHYDLVTCRTCKLLTSYPSYELHVQRRAWATFTSISGFLELFVLELGASA